MMMVDCLMRIMLLLIWIAIGERVGVACDVNDSHKLIVVDSVLLSKQLFDVLISS